MTTPIAPPAPRPGGALAARPLHFFWLCDCSGSMATDGKIQQLNFAIRECIPQMQEVARENPSAQVLVRAISFANGAQWHVAQPTPVDQFVWNDLAADGLTDMGAALNLLSEQLRSPPMPDRALQPVIALLTDGHPTDDFGTALRTFMALPWAAKALRVAIAIGSDVDLEVLRRFIAHPEFQPLRALNASSLVHYIKWTSTVALRAASVPQVQPGGTGTVLAVPQVLPPPPPPGVPSASGAGPGSSPQLPPDGGTGNAPGVW